MLSRHAAQRDHVVGDLLDSIAPEQVDVGMLGRDFPCLARSAAEIELGVGLLERFRCELGFLQRVVLAGVIGGPFRGPQRLQDRDLFLHDLVAFFLGPAHALGDVLDLALAGDEIDRDAAA